MASVKEPHRYSLRIGFHSCPFLILATACPVVDFSRVRASSPPEDGDAHDASPQRKQLPKTWP